MMVILMMMTMTMMINEHVLFNATQKFIQKQSGKEREMRKHLYNIQLKYHSTADVLIVT